jgi:RNA polymerase sigma factor (TIGR02999 family)
MANPQDAAAGDKSGNAKLSEELLPQVYAELRRLAASKLAAEPAGQTLQSTALVHEAWLRIGGATERSWTDRTQFFAAAAEAMCRILVDNARRKQTLKHGGGLQRVDPAHLDVAVPEDDSTVLAVSEVLDRPAAEDPQCAELIKLRFFAGLPNVEAARILGIAERTAKRTWAYARTRLYEELKHSQ